jgi:hypothetical protein
MMPTIELTDDEFHWACVALENAKDRAETRLLELQMVDQEDAIEDYQFLVRKYTELQEKFPPPMIDKDDLPKE